MEIHPRTLAATFRDMAREVETLANRCEPGSGVKQRLSGQADGLREAAEHLEQLADAEFERIMAESHDARFVWVAGCPHGCQEVIVPDPATTEETYECERHGLTLTPERVPVIQP